MKIEKTIYPDKPLPLQMWYNHVSLMVSNAKGINKPLQRIKAKQSKNKLKD